MRTRIIVGLVVLGLGILCHVDARAEEHGRATAMPGFFDGQLVTVLHQDFGETAAEALVDHNGTVNLIYETDGLLDVVDAAPGEDYNPIWIEVEVEFNAGFTPHQFVSAAEIQAAADSGEVTLTETDEVEICAIVGPRG
jgi:hypothetical protein